MTTDAIDPDLPDPREELERKTLETLIHYESAYRAGAIDRRAVYIAAKAVWSTVSGLVSTRISEEVANLANEVNATTYRRLFINPAKSAEPLSLLIMPGMSYTLVRHVIAEQGRKVPLKHVKADPIDLEEMIAKLVDGLKAGGYIEI